LVHDLHVPPCRKQPAGLFTHRGGKHPLAILYRECRGFDRPLCRAAARVPTRQIQRPLPLEQRLMLRSRHQHLTCRERRIWPERRLRDFAAGRGDRRSCCADVRGALERGGDELLNARRVLREHVRRKTYANHKARDYGKASSTSRHCTLPLNAADPRPAGPFHSSVMSHAPDIAKSPFASYTPGRCPGVTVVVPPLVLPGIAIAAFSRTAPKSAGSLVRAGRQH